MPNRSRLECLTELSLAMHSLDEDIATTSTFISPSLERNSKRILRLIEELEIILKEEPDPFMCPNCKHDCSVASCYLSEPDEKQNSYVTCKNCHHTWLVHDEVLNGK